MVLRRNLIPALALALLVVASPVAAQHDFDEVEVKTHEVADGIAMLEGAGGNIGVSAGEDGVILIDDQYAPLTEKIQAAVRKISDRPIRFVINTHWHFDHTGGNENLGKAGAVIFAHDNVRKRMSVDQFISVLETEVPASPAGALPVVTFSDTVTFHLNGDTIHVVHVPPAHTDGDSFVHFREANVLHLGDLFFSGMYPFIDVSAGGSLDGMIAACDTALELTDGQTRIIPGHGPLSNRADLEAYRNMLAGVRDVVVPLVQAGKSLDEITEAAPLEPFNEKWGHGFPPELFLTAVVADLSK
jgi:glyoxylase-like metal-dependent hydrolase (beta-lactamase superfamily II)